MGEKVKLTREQAKAIELIKHSKTEDERLIDSAITMRDSRVFTFTGTLETLNELLITDFAKALYIGYEINTASPEPQQIHADLQYLIYTVKEQAERAKGMQEIVDILQIRNDEWYEQNKRYREALEFYLSKNNWDEGRVYLDGGYRARKALEGEE